jgi:UDP-glucose 4-epimerase
VRIFVTGVAGFIGSRLAEALIAHGHTVVGVDDLSTGRRENVPAGVDWAVGDVAAIEGPFDAVYHCAASYKDRDNWERDARTNVLGTIAVVREALRNHARLVYFQTSLCYGLNPAPPIRPDAPLAPTGSYAVSKTAAEAYIRDSGVDYVSLRLANIYGPRNLSGPIPTFYKRITEGRRCTVVDSRRDYVYVDDLVWIAVRALTHGQGVYHVASGSDYSIGQLYEEVGRAIGGEIPEPIRIARGPDDAPSILLDPSETQRAFGWTAETPLWKGVDAAVEWYREHGVAETFTHLAMKG